MELSLVELVPPFSVPLVERPASPFIDEGGRRLYERKRERKARRKRASGVTSSFIPPTWVPPVL